MSAPSAPRAAIGRGRLRAFATVHDGHDGGWLLPGSLVLRTIAAAVLAVLLAGGASAWLVARAAQQDALQRLMDRQTDEVEAIARLLSSKIEQNQRVLATVAESIPVSMIDAPDALDSLLRQGLPAARIFDALQIARRDGSLSLQWQNGRPHDGAELDPAERDQLRRTLLEGKPLVSGVIGAGPADGRVMFTLPLRGAEEGGVQGALAGTLRLQSQGLLPPSMALPARADSRLVVFARDGTILAHPDPARVLGPVRSEAGLAQVYDRALQGGQAAVVGRGFSEVVAGQVVSVAGLPLPQWLVARVSDSRADLDALAGARQRGAVRAAAATAGIALLAALAIAVLAQPLARLRRRAERAGGQGLPDDDAPWPGGTGEVDAIARACRTLGDRHTALQSRADVLQDQFQAVLDHAPAGIVITRAGLLEVVGLEACRMLGYEPHELQGQPARLLYMSDAAYADLGRRVRAEFAAHGAFDGDVCFVRKDGGAVWARVLGRAVRGGGAPEPGGTVWMLEDLTAAREARKQEDWSAGHDPLTQLANREAFQQRLHALLSDRAPRPFAAPPGRHGEAVPPPQAPAAALGAMGVAAVHATASAEGASPPPSPEEGAGVMLFLDLDHFTVVNAIAGHDAGDDVLRHVGRLIENQVRHVGWAARLGGDEFAVVLPGCPLARGLAIATQLCAAVHAWEPAYNGRAYTLGVSIGLVPLGGGIYDVSGVLHAADMACYEAKRAGRNRVEVRWLYPEGPAALPVGGTDTA
ncbi:sensor domain-containing diguanylate cyclase [Paracidovorax konjaci]|uniref:PAS domain S-box-containing protein/diguanylate cyclase (GGDEF) domain-containing protein n=1 Tax=Paracidovorax konjaci TaxID=32040 RepID=A0A1I1RKQ2_9BURK|nr:diguanylate cyclase [Paracidovorax konjaci]SFD34617.1 PAS domain S-box-containing protein/diguanylate cyclase (GGDEF) domain-containing protein [Paracidovorax konjaci]